jgi:hypothetical protein
MARTFGIVHLACRTAGTDACMRSKHAGFIARTSVNLAQQLVEVECIRVKVVQNERVDWHRVQRPAAAGVAALGNVLSSFQSLRAGCIYVIDNTISRAKH